jgi:hypothetical protein
MRLRIRRPPLTMQANCPLGRLTRGFFCVRIDVFLVSQNRGASGSDQVRHHWLPDAHLRTIALKFCYSQPTPSVVVPHDGEEACLVERPVFRADSIIRGRSPKYPCNRLMRTPR